MTVPTANIPNSEVDLTNCESEPIHIPGYIQAHGYLVAITADTFLIRYASENIQQLVHQSATDLLGKPLEALLTGTDIPSEALMSILNVGKRDNAWSRMNPHRFRLNEQDWNLILHQHKDYIVLEWEPQVSTSGSLNLDQQLIAEALTEVQSNRTLSELIRNTARRVKQIIGYDRVMVYRFGPDWHGEVIAEEREPHLEPYLGLHYPASDIPRQARELYKINLVRIIADVGSTPSPIFSVGSKDNGQPLDLTHSVLRAVSPVHIEYLKNMGVQASMSISLLYRGELWGLISCHHSSPRFVDFPARQAAKFVSQLLSSALEFRKDEQDQSFLFEIQQNGQALNSQILKDWDVVAGLTQHPVTALNIADATGAVLAFDTKFYSMGTVPADYAVAGITNWLGSQPFDTVFETDRLPELYPPAENFRDVASGMMAIVLSKELNEYLLWFKPERIRQVTWAGNPDKPVTVDEGGRPFLHPRKSFEAWSQTVRNTSEPWKDAEISVAIKLREDVLQVVARKANEVRQLNERLRTAYEELDAFSYTVSHDLRTPLSSIRCYAEIIMEEQGAVMDEDTRVMFQKILDSTERMRSLIRHILYYSRMGRTELNFQPLDMVHLLEVIRDEILITETKKKRNVRIEFGTLPSIYGDPTMVNQVFTNLISNAAKYTQRAQEPLVRVEGRETDEEVIYTVRDNGIGFDMKHAAKMFDLFKRLDNAAGIEGTGVGLAIVKRIISRHRGKIWFHSEPNRETTFSVSFPKEQQVL
ncbi:light-regulated signal transduction histidine kinase (bacteriophytochrome) [Larkinella arboricola]|uniref:histidine kinase n=1 Tax=Larkinella arboricola TaxID=643671 RepID=A0A327X5Q4_LARAB|nr:ATP-binding protein [Larkinella arboricola]RAK02255.1 light-regulated signal transduction histidine kinase (bacteriophytochrome) [Larkinella arboricola]